MARFCVSGVVTVSAFTYVYADSEQEALVEAATRTNGIVLSQGDNKEEWIVDEIDGEVSVTGAERVG